MDCGLPVPTPGAEYGNIRDTKYNSFFYFGCQETFNLVGQTEKTGNLVRCEADGTWNFGDLRCEGPVCEDPGRPTDGYQLATSYEQVSGTDTLIFRFSGNNILIILCLSNWIRNER